MTSNRFEFGENWRKFNATLSDEQRAAARISLEVWFGDLNGKRLLDIGAGSGLFSAAAADLGAIVTAFDFDPATPAIRPGDVLDLDFMESLGEFDFVYSWGVLHHTGDMWEAMSNALGCVAPNGKALIALYSRPRFAPMQVAMKRLYNGSSNSLFRMTLKLLWATLWLSMELVGARRNPVRFVRDYAALNRGMSFWRDVEDWVGGWPFEFASASQVAERLPAGYAIERQNIAPRGACSEYLIARRA